MVNGKIILGTLSIIVALITFFEMLGEVRTGIDHFPFLPVLIILAMGTLGISVVRKGLPRKRKLY